MKPPDRRPVQTFEHTIGGVLVKLAVGFFDVEMTRPCEIFLDLPIGSVHREWASVWSRAVSLALQNGCPLDEITEHFRFAALDPGGLCVPPVETPEGPVRFAKSIPDLCAAVLSEWV